MWREAKHGQDVNEGGFPSVKLVEIGEAGELPNDLPNDDTTQSVVDATVGLYRANGFVRPWTGYLAVEEGTSVGTCGFKSPPIGDRVEIAYFTFPGHEGRGKATSMARELVRMAQREGEDLTIVAQTLPEENASTSILRKLGFHLVGTVEHPDDGSVWEWELRGS